MQTGKLALSSILLGLLQSVQGDLRGAVGKQKKINIRQHTPWCCKMKKLKGADPDKYIIELLGCEQTTLEDMQALHEEKHCILVGSDDDISGRIFDSYEKIPKFEVLGDQYAAVVSAIKEEDETAFKEAQKKNKTPEPEAPSEPEAPANDEEDFGDFESLTLKDGKITKDEIPMNEYSKSLAEQEGILMGAITDELEPLVDDPSISEGDSYVLTPDGKSDTDDFEPFVEGILLGAIDDADFGTASMGEGEGGEPDEDTEVGMGPRQDAVDAGDMSASMKDGGTQTDEAEGEPEPDMGDREDAKSDMGADDEEEEEEDEPDMGSRQDAISGTSDLTVSLKDGKTQTEETEEDREDQSFDGLPPFTPGLPDEEGNPEPYPEEPDKSIAEMKKSMKDLQTTIDKKQAAEDAVTQTEEKGKKEKKRKLRRVKKHVNKGTDPIVKAPKKTPEKAPFQSPKVKPLANKPKTKEANNQLVPHINGAPLKYKNGKVFHKGKWVRIYKKKNHPGKYIRIRRGTVTHWVYEYILITWIHVPGPFIAFNAQMPCILPPPLPIVHAPLPPITAPIFPPPIINTCVPPPPARYETPDDEAVVQYWLDRFAHPDFVHLDKFYEITEQRPTPPVAQDNSNNTAELGRPEGPNAFPFKGTFVDSPELWETSLRPYHKGTPTEQRVAGTWSLGLVNASVTEFFAFKRNFITRRLNKQKESSTTRGRQQNEPVRDIRIFDTRADDPRALGMLHQYHYWTSSEEEEGGRKKRSGKGGKKRGGKTPQTADDREGEKVKGLIGPPSIPSNPLAVVERVDVLELLQPQTLREWAGCVVSLYLYFEGDSVVAYEAIRERYWRDPNPAIVSLRAAAQRAPPSTLRDREKQRDETSGVSSRAPDTHSAAASYPAHRLDDVPTQTAEASSTRDKGVGMKKRNKHFDVGGVEALRVCGGRSVDLGLVVEFWEALEAREEFVIGEEEKNRRECKRDVEVLSDCGGIFRGRPDYLEMKSPLFWAGLHWYRKSNGGKKFRFNAKTILLKWSTGAMFNVPSLLSRKLGPRGGSQRREASRGGLEREREGKVVTGVESNTSDFSSSFPLSGKTLKAFVKGKLAGLALKERVRHALCGLSEEQVERFTREFLEQGRVEEESDPKGRIPNTHRHHCVRSVERGREEIGDSKLWRERQRRQLTGNLNGKVSKKISKTDIAPIHERKGKKSTVERALDLLREFPLDDRLRMVVKQMRLQADLPGGGGISARERQLLQSRDAHILGESLEDWKQVNRLAKGDETLFWKRRSRMQDFLLELETMKRQKMPKKEQEEVERKIWEEKEELKRRNRQADADANDAEMKSAESLSEERRQMDHWLCRQLRNWVDRVKESSLVWTFRDPNCCAAPFRKFCDELFVLLFKKFKHRLVKARWRLPNARKWKSDNGLRLQRMRAELRELQEDAERISGGQLCRQFGGRSAEKGKEKANAAGERQDIIPSSSSSGFLDPFSLFFRAVDSSASSSTASPLTPFEDCEDDLRRFNKEKNENRNKLTAGRAFEGVLARKQSDDEEPDAQRNLRARRERRKEGFLGGQHRKGSVDRSSSYSSAPGGKGLDRSGDRYSDEGRGGGREGDEAYTPPNLSDADDSGEDTPAVGGFANLKIRPDRQRDKEKKLAAEGSSSDMGDQRQREKESEGPTREERQRRLKERQQKEWKVMEAKLKRKEEILKKAEADAEICPLQSPFPFRLFVKDLLRRRVSFVDDRWKLRRVVWRFPVPTFIVPTSAQTRTFNRALLLPFAHSTGSSKLRSYFDTTSGMRGPAVGLSAPDSGNSRAAGRLWLEDARSLFIRDSLRGGLRGENLRSAWKIGALAEEEGDGEDEEKAAFREAPRVGRDRTQLFLRPDKARERARLFASLEDSRECSFVPLAGGMHEEQGMLQMKRAFATLGVAADPGHWNRPEIYHAIVKLKGSTHLARRWGIFFQARAKFAVGQLQQADELLRGNFWIKAIKEHFTAPPLIHERLQKARDERKRQKEMKERTERKQRAASVTEKPTGDLDIAALDALTNPQNGASDPRNSMDEFPEKDRANADYEEDETFDTPQDKCLMRAVFELSEMIEDALRGTRTHLDKMKKLARDLKKRGPGSADPIRLAGRPFKSLMCSSVFGPRALYRGPFFASPYDASSAERNATRGRAVLLGVHDKSKRIGGVHLLRQACELAGGEGEGCGPCPSPRAKGEQMGRKVLPRGNAAKEDRRPGAPVECPCPLAHHPSELRFLGGGEASRDRRRAWAERAVKVARKNIESKPGSLSSGIPFMTGRAEKAICSVCGADFVKDPKQTRTKEETSEQGADAKVKCETCAYRFRMQVKEKKAKATDKLKAAMKMGMFKSGEGGLFSKLLKGSSVLPSSASPEQQKKKPSSRFALAFGKQPRGKSGEGGADAQEEGGEVVEEEKGLGWRERKMRAVERDMKAAAKKLEDALAEKDLERFRTADLYCTDALQLVSRNASAFEQNAPSSPRKRRERDRQPLEEQLQRVPSGGKFSLPLDKLISSDKRTPEGEEQSTKKPTAFLTQTQKAGVERVNRIARLCAEQQKAANESAEWNLPRRRSVPLHRSGLFGVEHPSLKREREKKEAEEREQRDFEERRKRVEALAKQIAEEASLLRESIAESVHRDGESRRSLVQSVAGGSGQRTPAAEPVMPLEEYKGQEVEPHAHALSAAHAEGALVNGRRLESGVCPEFLETGECSLEAQRGHGACLFTHTRGANLELPNETPIQPPSHIPAPVPAPSPSEPPIPPPVSSVPIPPRAPPLSEADVTPAVPIQSQMDASLPPAAPAASPPVPVEAPQPASAMDAPIVNAEGGAAEGPLPVEDKPQQPPIPQPHDAEFQSPERLKGTFLGADAKAALLELEQRSREADLVRRAREEIAKSRQESKEAEELEAAAAAAGEKGKNGDTAGEVKELLVGAGEIPSVNVLPKGERTEKTDLNPPTAEPSASAGAAVEETSGAAPLLASITREGGADAPTIRVTDSKSEEHGGKSVPEEEKSDVPPLLASQALGPGTDPAGVPPESKKDGSLEGIRPLLGPGFGVRPGRRMLGGGGPGGSRPASGGTERSKESDHESEKEKPLLQMGVGPATSDIPKEMPEVKEEGKAEEEKPNWLSGLGFSGS
uniref:Uncharacterized protein n=1 Tax=Chromera velia CCMP2878 TaxID=1169474 RepID=A0A0G4I467_9ALVE|eukprot:Cvel_10849.t1-p1 / transcript=Cvel_10849.t1 / gene=Cvel_10849 / organism=Chromera_velia_CCMP2878 / gene_product=hypothetical protein / transcript_product=hypothetical protein / location=Cvel_scaffold664:16869-34747(+) / protein_length=3127 / sequence_SO=supercontig / SO=protein_coding / is_pseudo=false